MSYKVNDTAEAWKSVKGFEGLYEVSNLGNVRSLSRSVERDKKGVIITKEKTLRPVTHLGYKEVTLSKDKNHYWKKVHHLVATAFVSVPEELQSLIGKKSPSGYPLLVVNHKNNNKADNRAENLEWCTQRYNTTYKDAHKLRGEKLNKRIIQKDLKGNILAKYDSVTQAAIATNARASNISKCANHKYGFKTANGYIWEWDSSRYPVISLVPNESISNVKKIAEAKKPVTMAEIQQIEK